MRVLTELYDECKSMESPAKDKSKKSSYYYDTSDLVIIALFASLGGVFSTFIGYLANLVRYTVGIPKIGQIFAGLHILWFVLVFLLTNRKVGSVVLCGIIKGFIELFSASHLGILVLYISTGEAIVFEVIFFSFFALIKSKRLLHLEIAVAAGFAAVSNIILQLNTFLGSALSFELFLLIIALCFISGVGFGGYLGQMLFHLFQQSHLLDWRDKIKEPADSYSKRGSSE